MKGNEGTILKWAWCCVRQNRQAMVPGEKKCMGCYLSKGEGWGWPGSKRGITWEDRARLLLERRGTETRLSKTKRASKEKLTVSSPFKVLRKKNLWR